MSYKRLIIIQPHCACSKGVETTMRSEVIVQPVITIVISMGTTVVPLIKQQPTESEMFWRARTQDGLHTLVFWQLLPAVSNKS